MSKSISIIF